MFESGHSDADAVELRPFNSPPLTSGLSPSEFYDVLRAYTTRLEVELIVENSLKSLPKKQLNCTSEISEEYMRRVVVAEVRREVSQVVQHAVEEAVQRREEAKQCQCDHMLNTLREMEQRVNVLQRQVNELSHGHRRAYNLGSRLCSAIEGVSTDRDRTLSPGGNDAGDKLVGESLPRSRLFDKLLHALDSDCLDEARVLVTSSLAPFVAMTISDREQQPKSRVKNNRGGTTACTAFDRPVGLSTKCHGISPTGMEKQIKQPSTLEDEDMPLISANIVVPSFVSQASKGCVNPRSSVNTLHPYATTPDPDRLLNVAGYREVQSAIYHPFGHEGLHRKDDVYVENRVSPALGIEAVNAPADILPTHIRGDNENCNDNSGGGVRVLSIAPGGIAARSGVLAGDVIYAVGHRRVSTCEQLLQALKIAWAPHRDAGSVVLLVYRHRVRREVEVVLT